MEVIRDKITARVAHGATESVAGPRFEWIGNCKPFDSSARLSEGKHMVASAAACLFRRIMLRIGVCLDVKNTESCCTAVFRFDNQQDLACTQSRLIYKHQTLPIVVLSIPHKVAPAKNAQARGEEAHTPEGPAHTRPRPHPAQPTPRTQGDHTARTRPSPHPAQPTPGPAGTQPPGHTFFSMQSHAWPPRPPSPTQPGLQASPPLRPPKGARLPLL